MGISSAWEPVEGPPDALSFGLVPVDDGSGRARPVMLWAWLLDARGAVLVPTFAAAEAMLDGEGRGVPQYMLDKIRRISGAHVTSFRAALAAGVEVACGTDAGTPLNPHGRLSREAALFVAHGASPAQACRGCTGAAARAIGRDDVGVLQVGRRADLLLIAGNPLDDVEALSRVRAVFMDGLQVEGEACRSA